MTAATIPDDVLADIEKHAFSEVRHELGGVLFGTLTSDGAVVDGVIPALRATANQTSVTFTHEVWEEVHSTMDADHPDKRIVGWYHTHPGFGLFLSEHDLFIHQNFFSDERMVALVVDPLAGDASLFSWQDGKVAKEETFRTRTAAVPAPTALTHQDVRRNSRSRVIPLLVVAGLALAIGGYVLGSRTESTTVSSDSLSTSPTTSSPTEPTPTPGDDVADADAELRATIDSLRARAARLQKKLAEARDARVDTITYRVRSGDTLSSLAQAIYGDPNAFTRIVEANPGIDPDRLAIGQQIRLPVLAMNGD